MKDVATLLRELDSFTRGFSGALNLFFGSSGEGTARASVLKTFLTTSQKWFKTPPAGLKLARAASMASSAAAAATSVDANTADAATTEHSWEAIFERFSAVSPKTDLFSLKTDSRFKEAAKGHFSETEVTAENLIYFWLALIVHQEELEPIKALTVFFVLRDILENPVEMVNINLAQKPARETTREAYNAFLGENRPDKAAGGRLFERLLTALAEETSCFKGLSLETLQAFFQAQELPMRSSHMLALVHLALFNSTTSCVATLSYVLSRKFSETQTQDEITKATRSLLLNAAASPPMSATELELLPGSARAQTLPFLVEKILPLLQLLRPILELYICHQLAAGREEKEQRESNTHGAMSAGASSPTSSSSSPFFQQLGATRTADLVRAKLQKGRATCGNHETTSVVNLLWFKKHRPHNAALNALSQRLPELLQVEAEIYRRETETPTHLIDLLEKLVLTLEALLTALAEPAPASIAARA